MNMKVLEITKRCYNSTEKGVVAKITPHWDVNRTQYVFHVLVTDVKQGSNCKTLIASFTTEVESSISSDVLEYVRRYQEKREVFLAVVQD